MLQEPRQLQGRMSTPEGAPNHGSHLFRLLDVSGHDRSRACIPRMNQVVHQAQSMPLPHRPHLMLAIGIKRGESNLRELRRRQVHHRLPTAMSDHQLAALVFRRQHDHQSSKHPRRLFRVTVRLEEAPCLVHEQLVQLGRHRHALAPKARHHPAEDLRERLQPRRAAHSHAIRRHLPRAANGLVNQRRLPAPVGSLRRPRHHLGHLRPRHRKRKGTHALHLHPRHRQLQRPLHEKLPRPFHPRQHHLKFPHVPVVRDADALVCHAASLRPQPRPRGAETTSPMQRGLRHRNHHALARIACAVRLGFTHSTPPSRLKRGAPHRPHPRPSSRLSTGCRMPSKGVQRGPRPDARSFTGFRIRCR